MSEQFKQDLKPSLKQEPAVVQAKKPKPGSRKALRVRVQKLEETQRVILNSLKGAGFLAFSQTLIQKWAFADEADGAVFEFVQLAGRHGVLPKDVAAALSSWNLKYYDVSRRIVRMNKRLEAETGEVLFEKRGYRWALSRFGFDAYGAVSREEIEGIVHE